MSAKNLEIAGIFGAASPAVGQGNVTALDQDVTAGDPVGGTTETLHNVIQIDAPIQPGDS